MNIQYIPFMLNPEFPDATSSQKWEQFALWRQVELSRTDFTQLADTPLNEKERKKWKIYRQFLRDAPVEYKTVEELMNVLESKRPT